MTKLKPKEFRRKIVNENIEYILKPKKDEWHIATTAYKDDAYKIISAHKKYSIEDLYYSIKEKSLPISADKIKDLIK